MTPALEPSLLETLRSFDTPTICNGLELVAPERRTSGFTTSPFVAADPDLPPIVGYAVTATIRATKRPDPDQAKRNRLAYYEYIAQAPRPAIVVIQDLDPAPGFGAFWGEVNTNIHKSLGLEGAITNGSMRDLGMLAPGFQLLAGKLGPSHAWVHVVEFGGEVEVFGMRVHPGDLIHADRHGAIAIPREAAARVPAKIDLVARREKVVLEACRRPGFDIEALKRAMGSAEDIH